jgi:hypothetical protein
MPDEDLRGFADGELLDRLFPDSAGPIGQWFGLPHSRRVAFGFHSVRGKLELDGGRLWKLHKAAQDASRKRCDAATVMLRQAELVATYHPDPLTKAQTLEAKAWDGLVLREKFADTALRLTVVAAPGISKAFAQKISGGLISIRMPETAEADPDSTPSRSPTETEPERLGTAAIAPAGGPAPVQSASPKSKAQAGEMRKRPPGKHERADELMLLQIEARLTSRAAQTPTEAMRAIWKEEKNKTANETDEKRILSKLSKRGDGRSGNSDNSDNSDRSEKPSDRSA